MSETPHLHASERHEQTQNVVGAFEDTEDTQVACEAFQARLAHEAHAAENLYRFIAHPRRILLHKCLSKRVHKETIRTDDSTLAMAASI